MTIPSRPSQISYLGDGSAASFPIPFAFNSAVDLLVRITDMESGSVYTVTTGVTTVGGNGSTGTLVFSTPPAVGVKVTIIDDPLIEQNTSYQDNSAFPAKTHERALDLAARIDKRTRALIARSLRTVDGDPVSDLTLASIFVRKNKFLHFNANGEIEYVAGVTDQLPVSQSVIASLLNTQTKNEENAGVVPVDSLYLEGMFERYGAIGNGIDDDSAALNMAARVSEQGVRIYGKDANSVYRVTTDILVGKYFDLDLRGATLQPFGNTRGLLRDNQSVDVSTTIVSGAVIGSRTLVVADASGIVPGMLIQLYADDSPTNEIFSYPPSWSRVINVVGTTITIDSTLQVTYGGTINFYGYSDAKIGSLFRVVNGVLDGSESTYSANTGGGIFAANFAKVDVDVQCENWNNDTPLTNAVQIIGCLDVRLKYESSGGISRSNIADVQNCRSVFVDKVMSDGSHFGVNITRCDYASISDIHIRGRYALEVDDGVSPRSIRGLKFYGCGHFNVDNLHASDVESGIKVQACFRLNIGNVHVINCAQGPYVGQIAFNVSSIVPGQNMFGININNVVIENSGGVALGVASDDSGRVNISNLYIRKCYAFAIYSAVQHVQVTNLIVDDWATGGDYVAVYDGYPMTICSAKFINSNTSRPIFRAPVAGHLVSFSPETIQAVSGNPLFDDGSVYEAAGLSTIDDGSTSVQVTQKFLRSPEFYEIQLTLAGISTNPPGEIYATLITANGFTINSVNNPGSGGLNVAWRVRLKMPYVQP